MATEKLHKHDSYSSSTQKSTMDRQPAKRPYASGRNVHKGSIPKDPDGGMPMSGPNTSHHKRG